MQLTPTSTASAAAPIPTQFLLVRMREQADLSQEARLPRGPERRSAVWNDLVHTAARTQGPALDALRALQQQGLVLAMRSIPITNAIAVTAAPNAQDAVAAALRTVPAIESVLTRPKGLAPEPPEPFLVTPSRVEAPTPGVEWGVDRIGAPRAWAHGIDGRGVTIGIVDSGLDTAHPAIRAHYRGAGGSHDYNWIDTTGYTTGAFVPAAYDSAGHGTHVAGTAVGGMNGAAIGVAPGASVIAARLAFSDDMTAPISELDALQFMLAPTTTNGARPDARLGADIVNTSWSSASWHRLEARRAFDALTAAGTIVVASAGNRGQIRGAQIGAPGGLPGVIAVAASNSTDGVAAFSSSGPSPYDPGVRHPMFAAPGVAVRSSLPGGGYGESRGTSMAAPHVSGAIALLLQTRPSASVAEITGALARSARDISAPGPDLRSGFGRIDVAAAIDALRAPVTVPAVGAISAA